MITKYGFDIDLQLIQKNYQRLINQLWKLIPMRENDEDWHKQLETVINEIVGLNEILLSRPQFLQLLVKLEGIKNQECSFDFYRKTIFESINLLQELKNERV